MQPAPAAPIQAMSAIYNRDYVLIIDSSGSMTLPEKKLNPEGQSRWKSAEESTFAIADRLLEIVNQRPDSTGIELYLFANKFKYYKDIKDPSAVKQVFSQTPNNGTDLAGVLKDALKKYLKDKKHGRYKVKDRTPSDTLRSGKTIVVITDGIPDDEKAVRKRIIKTTHELDTGEELAISFIQVGDDEKAKSYLNHLDDELSPPKEVTELKPAKKVSEKELKRWAKFDIVDTVTMEEVEEIGVKEALRRAIFD